LTIRPGPAEKVAAVAAGVGAGLDRTEPGAAVAYVVDPAGMLMAATPSTHRVRTAVLA
jgi:hypothetical protein